MKQDLIKISSVTKILLLVFLSGTFLLSGCGSTSANTAKKTKKAKPAVEEKSEEDSNSETSESNTEANEKESSNKETESNRNVNAKDNKEAKKTEANKNPKKSEDKKTDEKAKKNAGDEIWADLMKGNKRFVEGKHTTPNFVSIRKALAGDQHPQVIVLGCADSRVPPELLFDKNLGELFVVRDAGNIGDEVSLGSIEYAIEHLHAKVLIILGHESCGAVSEALTGEEMPSKNLQAIVDRISPAFEGSKDCPIGGKINLECVELNIKHTANEMLMNSPIIKKAAKEDLTIIKAVYHLETGEVTRIN